MKIFRTLRLSTLLDIHSDFTAYQERMLLVEGTKAFEGFRKTILSVQFEIERRQRKSHGQ